MRVPSARPNQVSGEPAIAGCNAVAVRSSRRSDVHIGRCGRARARLFVDHCYVKVSIRVLFQQRGTLCHVRFYVSFSPPLFAGSFVDHFENTMVPS